MWVLRGGERRRRRARARRFFQTENGGERTRASMRRSLCPYQITPNGVLLDKRSVE